MNNYHRVAEAIRYITEHARQQPGLNAIAEAIHLSPYHFHRIFKEWAGVTPKNFLQYISLERAKKLLKENQTIEEATFRTGLSSSSRLHDLFLNIEGMTPGEFKMGGKALKISYQFTGSPFGTVLVASTDKGICSISFVDDKTEALSELKETWPHADFIRGQNKHTKCVTKNLNGNGSNSGQLTLHVQGTDFQLKVWEALLKIPAGGLVTYSDIAKAINNAKASRAVGSALAQNPIAFLIPCHRVIKKAGGIGEYRWGHRRKTAMIGWEAAQIADADCTL